MAGKLTAAGVSAETKPGRYSDGDGLGLFLRVDPGGAKFWVQRVMIRGRRSDLGLGSYPVVTLAKARAAAMENKRQIREGIDPLQAKRDRLAVLTFAEASRKVHELNLPTWRNRKHGDQFISTLEAYAFPTLGGLRVNEITSADVLAALSPIWTAKPETARRVRQRIGTVLKWCIAQGWRKDNPVDAIVQALPKHGAKVKAHRVSLPYADVAKVIASVKASGALASTKLALEWLVLTACRSGEARGARWGEVKDGVWTIPGSRMKAGKAHRVPLSARAMEILIEAEALKDGSGLLFPSVRGKELSDMTLSKLVKELGYPVDVHGFRTTFRTWSQEQTSTPREVAEAALAHVAGDATEQAYARSDLFEKRRLLMERWATFIALQAQGEAAGRIVPFAAKA